MRCFMYGSLWISIISMILCIGCSKNKTKESPKGPPPIAVRVATVERVTVPLEIKSNGRVSSPQKITIIPQVSGELIKVYVKEGDILNKGQEIFTIDSRTYKANYQASQAKLNKVKVQLDLAKKNYGRFKILKQKNYISDQELENKLTDIEVALSNMQSAQAELETSRIKLEYCQIKSPIEGKIGRILIQEGNFIRGGDSGSKLAEINVLDPIDVIFNITEDEFAEFRNLILSTKIPIYAELPGKSKGELKGDLIFIDNQVDTATGTLLLKGSFSNKALKLWPGEFVMLRMIIKELKDQLLLPKEAVIVGPSGYYVFVVKANHRVEKRIVVPKITLPEAYVIKEGIKAGETIVIDGMLNLYPGATVFTSSN